MIWERKYGLGAKVVPKAFQKTFLHGTEGERNSAQRVRERSAGVMERGQGGEKRAEARGGDGRWTGRVQERGGDPETMTGIPVLMYFHQQLIYFSAG